MADLQHVLEGKTGEARTMIELYFAGVYIVAMLYAAVYHPIVKEIFFEYKV